MISSQYHSFSRLVCSTWLKITTVVSFIVYCSSVIRHSCITEVHIHFLSTEIFLKPSTEYSDNIWITSILPPFSWNPPISFVSRYFPSISSRYLPSLSYPLLPLLDFNNKHSTVLTVLNTSRSTAVPPRVCYVYRQYLHRERRSCCECGVLRNSGSKLN